MCRGDLKQPWYKNLKLYEARGNNFVPDVGGSPDIAMLFIHAFGEIGVNRGVLLKWISKE
jgi:hypothetical protein